MVYFQHFSKKALLEYMSKSLCKIMSIDVIDKFMSIVVEIWILLSIILLLCTMHK